MKLITIKSRDGYDDFVVPITNVCFLRKSNSFYMVQLPNVSFPITKKQYDKIKKELKGYHNESKND